MRFKQNPLHNKASREIDLLLEGKCIWQAVGDFLEGADSKPSSRAPLQNLDGTVIRKIVPNLMLIFQHAPNKSIPSALPFQMDQRQFKEKCLI